MNGIDRRPISLQRPINVSQFGDSTSFMEHNESFEEKPDEFYLRSSRMDGNMFSQDIGVVSLQDKLSVDVPKFITHNTFEKRRNTAGPIENMRNKSRENQTTTAGSTGREIGERIYANRVRQV